MKLSRSVTCLLLAHVTALGTGITSGQDYPSKPVRMIATQPGGLTDVVARLIAPGLTANLGKQFIVDNRTAIVAVETAAKAPPDGYTILVNGSAFWLMPLLRDHVTWDPFKDFVPITMAVRSPSILVVHPSVPVKSVSELIALARARPGTLNYAAGTIGATPHLAAELFKYMVGVNMVRVGYKGTGPAVTAVMAGESQVSFPNAGSVMPHVKSGRLRGVAVCSAQPSDLAPGLPTVAATGLPGYESVSPQAVFAPAKMPPALIKRLNEEIVRVMHAPEVKERFFNTGLEVVASTPQELGAAMKAEVVRMGKVIKEVGIREE
jgi:tripartite-type tricarboxylate transporter receptor subunit TctC